MVVLSNSATQILQPGAAIVFDVTVVSTGVCTCHRKNSAPKMIRNGKYLISFGGNVASPTAATEVELSIAVGGELLPETDMRATSTAAGDVNSVSRTTIYPVCCSDYSRVTVVNSGTTPVSVGPNTSLVVTQI